MIRGTVEIQLEETSERNRIRDAYKILHDHVAEHGTAPMEPGLLPGVRLVRIGDWQTTEKCRVCFTEPSYGCSAGAIVCPKCGEGSPWARFRYRLLDYSFEGRSLSIRQVWTPEIQKEIIDEIHKEQERLLYPIGR